MYASTQISLFLIPLFLSGTLSHQEQKPQFVPNLKNHFNLNVNDNDNENELSHTEPTLEARAEAKLVWTMPCKEEEDDSQITEITEIVFYKNRENPSEYV